MTLIVRRSGEIGDPLLKRAPFPEPGVKASVRVSALTGQGVGGETVTYVEDAEGGTALTPGSGAAPTFTLLPSGVPAYRLDSTRYEDGGRAATAATIYRPSQGPAIKTMIAVGRIRRMPQTADGIGDASIDRVGSIVRGAGFNASLGIVSVNSATTPGALFANGDGATRLTGPVVGVSDDLHFFAVTFNAASSHLHYDGHITRGTLQAVASNGFFMGFSASGFQFEAVEVAHYGTALTEAQVQEKRAHYRTLYQF